MITVIVLISNIRSHSCCKPAHFTVQPCHLPNGYLPTGKNARIGKFHIEENPAQEAQPESFTGTPKLYGHALALRATLRAQPSFTGTI
mgnify:CR=1 FL=1